MQGFEATLVVTHLRRFSNTSIYRVIIRAQPALRVRSQSETATR
jgi:hypothetical protein